MRCISCHGEQVVEVVKGNRRYYHCDSCNKLYERVIDSRYGRDVTLNTNEGITHLSAGMVIWKGDKKFLLIKRRNYPFTYAFPAGHIEYNERPQEALKREVLEELGLKVTQSRLLFHGEIKGDKCRYGADSHIWYFYEGICEPGTPFLNSESESLDWYTSQQATKLELIPAARYLLDHVVVV